MPRHPDSVRGLAIQVVTGDCRLAAGKHRDT